MERLFPQYRDVVLHAGALADAGQPQAYEELLVLLRGDVDSTLHSLGTEEGLCQAMAEGKLVNGYAASFYR